MKEKNCEKLIKEISNIVNVGPCFCLTKYHAAEQYPLRYKLNVSASYTESKQNPIEKVPPWQSEQEIKAVELL